MPVPIKPIPDNPIDDSSVSNYSFLASFQPAKPKKKITEASNNDASLLFDLWTAGERGDGENTIIISDSMGISSREITRLKTMGFLTGGSGEVKVTRKGKIVITTMVLGETNKFESSKQEKSYTEILASMSKRGKPGYRNAQYSPNNSNCLNLKKLK